MANDTKSYTIVSICSVVISAVSLGTLPMAWASQWYLKWYCQYYQRYLPVLISVVLWQMPWIAFYNSNLGYHMIKPRVNISFDDIIISVHCAFCRYDTQYRGKYIYFERSWRYSATCNWCGFLSTVSSEASVIILTIITMDRYASITHPLAFKKRSMLCASTYMIFTWAIAILISAIPLMGLVYFNFEFYSTNGVCLPLQIHNPYSQGWEYSTSIFVAFNLLAFMINALAYLSMFITIQRSKLTVRSTQQLQDRTIAKRFAFIVGTDFVCWMPIIITIILAHSGTLYILSYLVLIYNWIQYWWCIINLHIFIWEIQSFLTHNNVSAHIISVTWNWRNWSTQSNLSRLPTSTENKWNIAHVALFSVKQVHFTPK